MARLLRFLSACLISASPLAAQDEPYSPPNVLLVYADDMGWGDLGVQNPDSKIPTPNLDQLAAEGLRCTDAHSSSGICTPSRFALLTGMYHWRRFHGIANVFGESVFEAEDVTLPELLRGAGYDTACIGKWHLGWDWESLRRPGAESVRGKGYAPGDFDWSQPIPDGPLAHGFDHYFGDDVPNFPPYTWIEDDRVLVAPTLPLKVAPKPTEGSAESRPGPMAEGWRQDAVMPRITARAVSWLAEPARKERPFFLYFPWTSPHAPITPAGEYRGSTEAGGFGDFLHQSDAHLGEVLAALKASGLADNTLVIFTADNGPEHYAYARVRDSQHRSTGPLRGLKRDVYEGGHRVPFLVRWPGVIKPGSVSDALTSQIDLYRTIAVALGIEVPEGAAPDSINQFDVWESGEKAPRSELIHNTYKDRWALRQDDWLYVTTNNGATTRIPEWYRESEKLKPGDTPGLLFNLKEDIGQKNNLWSKEPKVVERMAERLRELRGIKR